MPAGGTHQAPKPLVPVNRPVGQNDVGMVAWTLTMKTPECPQGRKVSGPWHCAVCCPPVPRRPAALSYPACCGQQQGQVAAAL